MKELTFSIQNKQGQELSIVMQGHKVPITIIVGTSHMDLEMEDVDDLIKALHMMKSQHKTFVNVEPMGMQGLKQLLDVHEKPKPHHADYKKIEDQLMDSLTAKEIRLKVGQKYKDRKGRINYVVGVLEKDNHLYERGYRFRCRESGSQEAFCYTEDGKFYALDKESEYDLVELIEDVPSQPDKDEHGRWILNEGDTVMLSNGVEGVVCTVDESNIPYFVEYFQNGYVRRAWLAGTDIDALQKIVHITSIIKRAK